MAASNQRPPPAELLTALQDRVNTLCALFFDYTGSLQRDALPVLVTGQPDEQLAAPARQAAAGEPAFDVSETTSRMAAQIMEEFRATEALVRSIPDETAGAEAAQYERIRQLQQEDADLSQELAETVAEANQQLGRLQAVFALLAQHTLSGQQHTGAAGPAAGGAGGAAEAAAPVGAGGAG